MVRRGDALLRAGDVISAQAYFRDAISVDPHSARALDGLGRLYLGRGEYGDAIAVYQRGMQVQRDDSRLVVGLARVYERMGRLESAAAALRAYVRRKPGSGRAQRVRAEVAEKLGQWAEALDAYRALLDLALRRDEVDVDDLRLRVRALSVLVGELDPVTMVGCAETTSPVRRALARCPPAR